MTTPSYTITEVDGWHVLVVHGTTINVKCGSRREALAKAERCVGVRDMTKNHKGRFMRRVTR